MIARQTSRIAMMLVGLSFLVLPGASDRGSASAQTSAHESFFFVVNAPGGSLQGDVLVMQDVPGVIYVSNRPQRVAGLIDVQEFLTYWTDPSDTDFASDPPNAAVSFLSGEFDDAVVELRTAERNGDDVHFTVQLIDGSLPTGEFGPAVLFIDPAWNPGPGG